MLIKLNVNHKVKNHLGTIDSKFWHFSELRISKEFVNVTSCDLEEQLVRESEDMLEILFLIIGCICGLSGILYAFEWIMSGRRKKR